MIDAGRRAMQRKRRRDLVVLAILLFVAVGLMGYRIAGRLGEASAVAVSERPVVPKTTEPAPEAIAVTWPLDVPHDPFREILPQPERPVQVEAKLSPDDLRQQAARLIHLQGIIIRQEPMLIIDGAPYRRGHTVHGFRIKEIHSRYAVLERDGIDIELGF